MGHYDSCYEYDRNESSKKLTKKRKDYLYEVEQFAHKLRYISDIGIPIRFLDNLDDMYNWLKVNSK